LCWVYLRWSWELFGREWLLTLILLISASWVARITVVSQWHLEQLFF
jgi:hypothetical protein